MKTNKLTGKQLLLIQMSQDINQWLHIKGEDVHRYVNFLDRCCDIKEVLEESLKKTMQSGEKIDKDFADLENFLERVVWRKEENEQQ